MFYNRTNDEPCIHSGFSLDHSFFSDAWRRRRRRRRQGKLQDDGDMEAIPDSGTGKEDISPEAQQMILSSILDDEKDD